MRFSSPLSPPNKAGWQNWSSLLLCVRVPKSGSTSLGAALRFAFSSRGSFYVPNTLDLDGCLSRFQRVRFHRNRLRNLLAHYRSPWLARAFEQIEQKAVPGDLLCGGHIDFGTVRKHLSKDIKIVTILRNPYDRCRSEYFYAPEILPQVWNL